jgi:hypothetical protein
MSDELEALSARLHQTAWREGLTLKILDFSGSYEFYNKDGQLHCESGPAQVITDGKGHRTELYCRNGRGHREDGPATILIESHRVTLEIYALNGKQGRIDNKPGAAQPSYITYNADGSGRSYHYFVNGKRHRTDGPAVIAFDRDGSAYRIAFYIDGKEVPPASIDPALSTDPRDYSIKPKGQAASSSACAICDAVRALTV